MSSNRPVKIVSASGAITDMVENLAEVAEHADADFIIGDWMSEYNMSARAVMKVSRLEKQTADGDHDDAAFEQQFVDSVIPALPHLARRGIRLAVNAGASDTERLHARLEALVREAGLPLKVSWVEGDEVLPQVLDCLEEEKTAAAGESKLRNLTTGQNLRDWPFKPLYAQCYLGCWGIVEAFRAGADIVVCGRVADAAPTMAAAAVWHDWSRTQYAELAHSLVAGHLIECSYYVTGGNFSGFKGLPAGTSPLLHMPVARVQKDGSFFIELHRVPGRGGGVSVETVRAQFLYELQGPFYYNSDVVAYLPDIKIEAAGPDSVYVHNVGFEKPPPTTKVGVTAFGGYQAEVHYYVTGLDLDEKVALLEKQLRLYLGVDGDKDAVAAGKPPRYSHFAITAAGVPESNPKSQDRATVEVRIIAQASTEAPLAREQFLAKCWNIVMSTYPGATFAVDARQGLPRPYCEYFVTILPLDRLNHVSHNPWAAEPALQNVVVPAPADTVPYRFQQVESNGHINGVNGVNSVNGVNGVNGGSLEDDFGPTTMAPLGYIVHARSGDKSSDCNVGFFVRNADEYPWLRRFLTTERIIELLQGDYNGKRIERFELSNIQGALCCEVVCIALCLLTQLSSCSLPSQGPPGPRCCLQHPVRRIGQEPGRVPARPACAPADAVPGARQDLSGCRRMRWLCRMRLPFSDVSQHFQIIEYSRSCRL